jgi:hypothetical protein
VQQYEDAIKMYRAGKPVDFNELPTPPGMAYDVSGSNFVCFCSQIKFIQNKNVVLRDFVPEAAHKKGTPESKIKF